jgi:hypothetical protein
VCGGDDIVVPPKTSFAAVIKASVMMIAALAVAMFF